MRRVNLHTALPVLSVLAFLLLWQLFVIALRIPDFILPTPLSVLSAIGTNLSVLLANAGTTLVAIGAGYGVGVVVGIALAVAMTVFPLFRIAIYPLVVASQTLPKVAIAPLLILWFGVGLLPKLIIVALLAFFPVLINTVAGLESANRSQLELMRSVNASVWQVYRNVRLPAAVPYIFAGLKLALTVSIIGAVVGEWVAANKGLGYLLVSYNSSLQTRELFAALVVLVAISAITFLLISLAERRFSWEARQRRAEGRSNSASRPKARPGAGGEAV